MKSSMRFNLSMFILVDVAGKEEQDLSSSIKCKHMHTHTYIYTDTHWIYTPNNHIQQHIYVFYRTRVLNLFQMFMPL